MNQDRAGKLSRTWALFYSIVLLAVVFHVLRRLFFEWSSLWTTNVPWVASVLVIAALGFVGILAILVLASVVVSVLTGNNSPKSST